MIYELVLNYTIRTQTLEVREHTILYETVNTIFFDTKNSGYINPLTKTLKRNIGVLRSIGDLGGVKLTLWCYSQDKQVSLQRIYLGLQSFLEGYAKSLTSLTDNLDSFIETYGTTINGWEGEPNV